MHPPMLLRGPSCAISGTGHSACMFPVPPPPNQSEGETLTERSGQVLNQELPGDRELMKPPPASL